MEFLFEWDEVKARQNLRRHRVAFEEAVSVSERGRIILVVHTDRGNVIRLISCRKVTAAERKTYEQ